MGKDFIIMCNNGKSQRTILHAPVSTLSEISINQGQEVLTKFYRMFAEFLKGIRQGPRLPRSFYAAAEGALDSAAPRRCGRRHEGHRKGVPERLSFCRSHPVSYQGTDLGTRF